MERELLRIMGTEHQETIEILQEAIEYTLVRISNLEQHGSDGVAALYRDFTENLRQRVAKLEGKQSESENDSTADELSIVRTSQRKPPAKRRAKREQAPVA